MSRRRDDGDSELARHSHHSNVDVSEGDADAHVALELHDLTRAARSHPHSAPAAGDNSDAGRSEKRYFPPPRLPDDADAAAVLAAEGADFPETGAMSRAPLLVRSSPALGTASYGGIPYSAGTSPEYSDEDLGNGHHASRIRTGVPVRGARNGLYHTASASEADEQAAESSRTQNGHGRTGRVNSFPIRQSRRRRPDRSRSGGSGDDMSDGFYGSGAEPRFSTDSAIIMPQPMTTAGSDESGSWSSDEGRSDASDTDLLTRKKKPARGPADDSPYPQVRASVPPTDDITLSINTPRMWSLSILFAIFGSATNLFFSLRYPSVSITPIIALLLAHPLGLLWDGVLKRKSDPPEMFLNGHLVSGSQTTAGQGFESIPEEASLDSRQGIRPPALADPSTSWKRRLRLYLAQGRWNQKEHCCVFIASNVSFGFAFATDVGTSVFDNHTSQR